MGALAPGFRFCPTDEELLIYYLRPKAWGKSFHIGTIAEVDIYKFEPWDLPDKSALATNDPEWYFFSTQDKKYSHTARINRTTTRGYWKATGKDRTVSSGSCIVGMKKTLIYYEGRAPNGRRTNWIMHEYRLDHESEKKEKGISVSVLCRIRKKGGRGPRNGEQYGAPIWNEGCESDEDPKPLEASFSNKAGSMRVSNVGERGNAFNLQNQVEDLQSPGGIGPVKVEFSHNDTDVNSARITNAASDWQVNTESASAREGTICKTDFKGIISDTACFDTAPHSYHFGEDPLSYHQPNMDLQDTGSLFDLDTLPPLPTLADYDGQNLHDYVFPAFDESEILEEVWSLVSDGFSSKEVNIETVIAQPARPECVSHVVGGDYLELDDIEAPLYGFALRSPIHGDEIADKRVATMGDSLLSKGAAAQSVRLQIPASTWSEGRIKNIVTPQHLFATQTLPPQVQNRIYKASENVSIPIPRESHNVGSNTKNFQSKLAGPYSGSSFKSCVTPHAVESSTRSYLSKHMSTYTVSKCEVVPARLCYASLTDMEGGSAKENKTIVAATALRIKDEKQIDASLDAASSTSLPTKPATFEKNRPEGIASLALERCIPYISCAEGSSLDTEDALLEGCNLKGEDVTMSSSRRLRLKTSLKGLMSKWKQKQSALAVKFVQLEEGVRMKFNDKLSARGKSAAQLFPTDNDANPFDRLKKGIMATLFHLAIAFLIFSFLFWGYRIVTKCASYVSVQ